MEEKPLVISGKSFISSKRAAVLFNYTTDYIGQLCRSKKILSVMVGRDRFVDYSSIVNYVESIAHPVSGLDAVPSSIAIPTPLKVEEPAMVTMPESPISSLRVQFWATSLVAVAGLLMFFGLSDIGSSAISSFHSNSTAFLQEDTTVLSASPVVLVNFGSFLRDADRVYIGFLNDVERAIAKLWKRGSNKLIAFVKSFAGTNRPETVIVKNTKPTSSSTLVEAPSSVLPDTTVVTGLSEADVRMIAREIIEEEISRTIDYSSRPASSNLGIVIKPGSGDPASDGQIVEAVKNSFSDEVKVSVDQSRSSGIIRPVFRNPTDDYYNFILVPVSNAE